MTWGIIVCRKEVVASGESAAEVTTLLVRPSASNRNGETTGSNEAEVEAETDDDLADGATDPPPPLVLLFSPSLNCNKAEVELY